jgi:hypothetical protein
MENPPLEPLVKRIKVRALRFYSANTAPAGRYVFRPPFTGAMDTTIGYSETLTDLFDVVLRSKKSGKTTASDLCK